jgi:hypothetical protein
MAQGYISRRNRIKSSDTYRVRLYRYGQIWKTINVKKGNAVTLTACDVAYDDDKFYGWSTDPQSVTRSYAPTATFRPTTNLNLYAIFSYIQNSTVQQSKSVSATLDQDQTLTVTDATVGTAYTITRTDCTSISQGQRTTPGVYNGNPTTYTTYYPDVRTVESTIENGTATSGTISYSANAGTPTTGRVLSGAANWESSPSYVNVTIYPSIHINYITTITQTGTKYRVASHDIESKINIFVYGELTKTVSIKEGLSATIGEVISQYSDDTFVGYSTEPNSTTRTYVAASSIELHGEMNLYAVFSYLSDDTENLRIYSDTTTPSTITINADGTCRISADYKVVKVTNGTGTIESESSAVALGTKGTYAKINNTALTGTTPIEASVVAGNKIEVCGYYESDVNSSRNGHTYTYTIQAQYPNHPTLYRVSAHI